MIIINEDEYGLVDRLNEWARAVFKQETDRIKLLGIPP